VSDKLSKEDHAKAEEFFTSLAEAGVTTFKKMFPLLSKLMNPNKLFDACFGISMGTIKIYQEVTKRAEQLEASEAQPQDLPKV
jgi:hypothetical protein